MAVGIYKGKLTAVFLQGIFSWDLKSGQLLAEIASKQENTAALLGEKYAVHINSDFHVNFVNINFISPST
jgi:hypothetical protein